jgi:hypothetical protein
MHSEGHIVAHLHITEIEHEHPGVRVNESDNEEANQDACKSPRPSNGTLKAAAEDEIRTGYDSDLERKPGVNARGEEGSEERIKLRNVNDSNGSSKRSSSDYIGEC